jgi:hypothetical protein
MKRAWVGVAVLAASWLFGLSYYHQANWAWWMICLCVGVPLFSGVVVRWPTRWESAAALALLLPAIWLAPWPYRAAPLLIALGLLPVIAGGVRWRLSRSGAGIAVAGIVLLAQSLGLLAYEHLTARSHELPLPFAHVVSDVANLLGIESSVDSHDLVLHTMRRMHRLGLTWELLVDPATFCFFVGGLALIAIRGGTNVGGRVFRRIASSMGRLALVFAAWLPIRAGIFIGVLLHRAVRTDFDSPLTLTTQFWNPWFQLLLLAGPVLLAWRFLTLDDRFVVIALGPRATPRPAMWPMVAASMAAGLAVALYVVGQFWDAPGARKLGRVAVDERHSNWERTDRPMDTNWYGQLSTYNYSCIYDYLSRFYQTSRLMDDVDEDSVHAIHGLARLALPELTPEMLDKLDEVSAFHSKPIDDQALANVDVLIIKTPTKRYAPDEIAAIRRFVERGGGLMLIGEHTDVFHTGEYLNSISRTFGFQFRYDCLFGVEGTPEFLSHLAANSSPFDERYVRPLLAHPMTQRMPPLDFEISCSLDPGFAYGTAVMSATGLWNLPADYFAGNYYPQVEDRTDARYGAWIQTWAMRHGAGRVVAYTDSTQFSNFSTFEPGKPEVMMGMVEWLNHAGGRTWLNVLLIAGAIVCGLIAIGLAVGRNGAWLLLIAGGATGWAVGAVAVRTAHMAELPMPTPARSMTEVVMDRTVSSTPLPKGGFIAGKEDGFGIFERNVLRLGYFTSRQSDEDALRGNLLVVLHPDREVSPQFRDAVESYVRRGGKLLVLDSPQNQKSTANSLLYPFNMAVDHATNFTGTLAATGSLPAVPIPSACQIIGGDPLASFDGAPPGVASPPVIAATKRFWFSPGTVTVVGFATRFTDVNMGVTGDSVPDAELGKVYELEYQLLRGIIDNKPRSRAGSAPLVVPPSPASLPAK